MPIFNILFLLFLLVPVVEIYLLIKVGSALGATPTIALVVFTAVLGALLLRYQGLYTVQQVRAALARGEMPAMAMLEGVVLVVCGALLLTPGFFTDAIGFLGLIPAVRRAFIRRLLQRGLQVQGLGPHGPGPGPGAGTPFSRGAERDPERRPTIIDGDYTREDDK